MKCILESNLCAYTFFLQCLRYLNAVTIIIKRQTQPEWFNDEIKEASKKRDIYHKQKNWKQYKYWRNKTNSLIKDSKKKLFSDAIQEQKASNVL